MLPLLEALKHHTNKHPFDKDLPKSASQSLFGVITVEPVIMALKQLSLYSASSVMVWQGSAAGLF